MSVEQNPRRIANAASVGLAVMVAQLMAGRAVRDGVFLSEYTVSSLPPVIVGSSLLTIVAVLLTARLMTRFGAGRVLPIGLLLSGGLWLADWGVYQLSPGIASILIFIHLPALGGTMVSGLWSLANEHLEPRSAKRLMARIALGGSVGALIGGLAAERVAAWLGASLMLPILAGMSLLCAWRVLALREPADSARGATGDEDEGERASGLEVLANMPYLRSLAVLLLLCTMSAALIEFVLKAHAAETWDGDDLTRFFAIFYTSLSLVTLALQAAVVNPALGRLGLAKTMATLPLAVVTAGVVALAVPGLLAVAILMGAEAVVRGSFFRSGYEILYTPVPRAEKRATKAIIDGGFQRAGEAFGAALVAVLLLAPAALAMPLLIAVAVALALVAGVVAVRLHAGYVQSLERSLETRAAELELDEVRDSTTRLTLLQTFGTNRLEQALARASLVAPVRAPAEPSSPRPSGQSTRTPSDPAVDELAALRSGDPKLVKAALTKPSGLRPSSAPQAIALLARQDAHRLAARALCELAPRITGQLIDALLDPNEPLAVRRRIPRVLASGEPARAAAALLRGLCDESFRVRYQSGRALAQLARTAPEQKPPRARVHELILHELAVDREARTNRRLHDEPESNDGLGAGLPAGRVKRSLEHVFTLLTLLLPPKPVKVAFRGLHTDDASLRGTALEYLETALPDDIRVALWPVLEEERPPALSKEGKQQPYPDRQAAADRLLESNASIELNLEQLRKRLRESRE